MDSLLFCQIIFFIKRHNSNHSLLHSGREGSHHKSTVGLFTEYKRINISLTEEYRLDWIAFSLSREQPLKIRPHQKCYCPSKTAAGGRPSYPSLYEHLSLKFNKIVGDQAFSKKSGKAANDSRPHPGNPESDIGAGQRPPPLNMGNGNHHRAGN